MHRLETKFQPLVFLLSYKYIKINLLRKIAAMLYYVHVFTNLGTVCLSLKVNFYGTIVSVSLHWLQGGDGFSL